MKKALIAAALLALCLPAWAEAIFGQVMSVDPAHNLIRLEMPDGAQTKIIWTEDQEDAKRLDETKTGDRIRIEARRLLGEYWKAETLLQVETAVSA